jgi:hypothetical protein
MRGGGGALAEPRSYESLSDETPWSAALLALVARNAALQPTTLLRTPHFNDADGTAARRAAVAALRARLQAQLAVRETRLSSPGVGQVRADRGLPGSDAAAVPALAQRHGLRVARRPSRNAAAAAPLDAVHQRLVASRAYAAAARRRAQALRPSVHPVFPHPHPWLPPHPLPTDTAAASSDGSAHDANHLSQSRSSSSVASADGTPTAASPGGAAADVLLRPVVTVTEAETRSVSWDTAVALVCVQTQTDDAVAAPCAQATGEKLPFVIEEMNTQAADTASPLSGEAPSAAPSFSFTDEQADVCASDSLQTDGSLSELAEVVTTAPREPAARAEQTLPAAYDARAVLLQRLRLQRCRACIPAPLLLSVLAADENDALGAPALATQLRAVEAPELQPADAADGNADGDDDEVSSCDFAHAHETDVSRFSAHDTLQSPWSSLSPDSQPSSPVACASPLLHVVCDAERAARVTEAVLRALQRGQVLGGDEDVADKLTWRDVALDTGNDEREDAVTRLLFDAVVEALSLQPLGASALSVSLWQHRMTHLDTPAAFDAACAAVRRFTDAWLAAATANTDAERQRLLLLCELDVEERAWAAAVERETVSILHSTTERVYEAALLALTRDAAAEALAADAEAAVGDATPLEQPAAHE